MRVRRLLIGVLVAAFAMGVAAGSTTQVKKAKGTRAVVGSAGAVNVAQVVPARIDDADGQGYYCTKGTPNVHHLGTMGANWGVVVDFESSVTSDPIAILTTLKINGTDLNAENVASDDDGGNLNPRFELRRNYVATYVLTVGTADGDEACYAYRMRVVAP